MKKNVLSGTAVFLVVVAMMLAARAFSIRTHAMSVSPQVAPDFTLPSVNGQPVRLSDYRGKAVVLNFWATWCPPCRMEIPWFIDLQKKHAGDGLQIIGVAMDNGGSGSVAAFAQRMGINYTVLIGNQEVGELYGGVYALPTTVYIGRDGRILKYVSGLLSHYEIDENIKEALKPVESTMQAAAR